MIELGEAYLDLTVNSKKVDVFDLNKMKLSKKIEYELDTEERKQILEILSDCFPDFFQNRIFYKKIPTFRLLAKYNDKIVGQVGVEQRAIFSKEFGLIYIFGIVDLCVNSTLRGHSIATLLLKNIERLAREADSIDCLMLFADEQKLYKNFGFYNSDAKCKFLAIDDLNSMCILEKNLNSSLMIKNIKTEILLKDGIIDVLGHVF